MRLTTLTMRSAGTAVRSLCSRAPDRPPPSPPSYHRHRGRPGSLLLQVSHTARVRPGRLLDTARTHPPDPHGSHHYIAKQWHTKSDIRISNAMVVSVSTATELGRLSHTSGDWVRSGAAVPARPQQALLHCQTAQPP